MGEAYLTIPPSFFNLVGPKTTTINFDDKAEWPNGPSGSPYRKVTYTVPFVPDEVEVKFTQLSYSAVFGSGHQYTEYYKTGSTVTLAQGSVVNLIYATRSQGSTDYYLYYQIGLSSATLFYQITYQNNKYNEWDTHNVSATAKCTKY